METLAKGDISIFALLRLLEATAYHLKPVKQGHVRTVEDILAEYIKLDTHVWKDSYWEHGEYALSYLPDADQADFVSLTMPVREVS